LPPTTRFPRHDREARREGHDVLEDIALDAIAQDGNLATAGFDCDDASCFGHAPGSEQLVQADVGTHVNKSHARLEDEGEANRIRCARSGP
jgi:hypothetical protein